MVSAYDTYTASHFILLENIENEYCLEVEMKRFSINIIIHRNTKAQANQ